MALAAFWLVGASNLAWALVLAVLLLAATLTLGRRGGWLLPFATLFVTWRLWRLDLSMGLLITGPALLVVLVVALAWLLGRLRDGGAIRSTRAEVDEPPPWADAAEAGDPAIVGGPTSTGGGLRRGLAVVLVLVGAAAVGVVAAALAGQISPRPGELLANLRPSGQLWRSQGHRPDEP